MKKRKGQPVKRGRKRRPISPPQTEPSRMSPETMQHLFWVGTAVCVIVGALFTYGGLAYGRIAASKKAAVAAESQKRSFAAVRGHSTKQHNETRKALESIAQADRERHEELLRALNVRELSLEAQLWEKYPWGFVVFGADQGNIVNLPLRKKEIMGKSVKFKADWANAKINLAENGRLANFDIPHASWWVEGGGALTVEDSQIVASIPLIPGRPMMTHSGFFIPDAPQMFFEVLDASPVDPLFVVGFRALSRDELLTYTRKKRMPE